MTKTSLRGRRGASRGGALGPLRARGAPLALLVLATMLTGLLPPGAAFAQAVAPAASPSLAEAPLPSISPPSGDASRLSGATDVPAPSADGAARYTYPFAYPAARGGVQLSLSLEYASTAGSGPVGRGWTLPVPSIRRATSNTPVSANVGSLDHFVVADGRPLTLVCLVGDALACDGVPWDEAFPAWSKHWSYYRTAVDDGARYFLSGDSRTWRIQWKDGSTFELGAPLAGPTDLGALEVDPNAPGVIRAWYLARAYDHEGVQGDETAPDAPNQIRLRYTVVGGGDPTAALSDVYSTLAAGRHADAADSDFADHLHFAYDTAVPLAAGRRQLVSVDVTSQPTGGGTRQLVRRYHLDYEHLDSAEAYLSQVTLEGRCDTPIAEGVGGLLPATSCPRLAPDRFEYTGTALQARRLAPIAVPPFQRTPPAVFSHDVEMVDVDGDGFTDILDGSSFPYTAYLNRTRVGAPWKFEATPVELFHPPPVPFSRPRSDREAAVTAGTALPTFADPHVLLGDFNGDGRIDMLYAPSGTANASWVRFAPGVGRLVAEPWDVVGDLPFPIDRSSFYQYAVVDLDGDGKADIVRSDGESYDAMFAGVTRFGNVMFTGHGGGATAVHSCVMSDGEATAAIGRPGAAFADMNGDGKVDIVLAAPGRTVYWPGHGDGHFGAGGDFCDPSTRAGATVVLGNSPTFGRLGSVDSRGVRIADVDRDGYADLTVFEGTTATVYRNELGLRFGGAALSIDKLPNAVSQARTVRIGVLGRGGGTGLSLVGPDRMLHAVALVQPSGPGLLQAVHTSAGSTTTYHYIHVTDVAQASTLDALSSPIGDHWMVSVIVQTDHLERLGRTEGAYATSFTYEQPFHQQGRHGFKVITATRHGASAADDLVVRRTFNFGACIFLPGGDPPCVRRDGTNIDVVTGVGDDPLAGTVSTVEVRSGAQLALSTTTYDYDIRPFLVANDARVYFVGPRAVDTYRFEPSAPAEQESVPFEQAVVRWTGQPPFATSSAVVLPSKQGRAHVKTTYENDAHGNTVDVVEQGCVDGCAQVDEPKVTHTVIALHPGDKTGWGFRALESHVSGTHHPGERVRKTTYDALGRPVAVEAVLEGTLPLKRYHASGHGDVAAAPPSASMDGTVTLSTLTYDDFGNVVRATGPTGECTALSYDTIHVQLLADATVGLGGAGSRDTCNGPSLVTTFEYDRGLGRVIETSGPSGATGRQTYDGFGRLTARYAPDPTALGQVSPHPSLRLSYVQRTSASDLPYSGVFTEWLDDSGGAPVYRQGWTFLDALGRTLVRYAQADRARGDRGDWVASGLVERDVRGRVIKAYAPWFVTATSVADPTRITTPTEGFDAYGWDAFERMTTWTRRDGSQGASFTHHALSYDAFDALALEPNGVHANTPTTTTFDGHGRVSVHTTRLHEGKDLRSLDLRATYLPTGEPETVTQVHVGTADAPVTRWMRYDTLGRMVLNVEPNTSPDFTGDPNVDAEKVGRAWRYAWDPSGRLVGTSDPRGCGKNVFYDRIGRRIAEDYSPCVDAQAPYSPPNLQTGDGTEVFNVYDTPPSDLFTSAGLRAQSVLYPGALVATFDRGAARLYVRDARGRVTQTAERIVKPGEPSPALATRYAAHWYKKSVALDDLGRAVSETTGAEVAELLATGAPASGASVLSRAYDARGLVRAVTSSYGALVTATGYGPDGLPESVTFGDAAKTTTTMGYDSLRRLTQLQTSRAAAPAWSTSPPAISPSPAAGAEPTRQLLIDALTFGYDAGGNPKAITDGRDPSAWPAGERPVSRTLAYDDLERVRRVDFDYGGASHDDAWVAPDKPEQADGAAAPRVRFGHRLRWITYDYDWRGNRIHSGDDAGGFYDRSLGEEHMADHGGPHQLGLAANTTEPGTPSSTGSLGLQYDEAGNVVLLALGRDGPCVQATCDQTYVYDWDEVGRLARARRFDGAADPVHGTAAADLRYAYDGSNARVLKSSGERHTLYVFSTLEERGARFDPHEADYGRSAATEQVLLGGVARVVLDTAGMPTVSGQKRHVLLTLPDALGSTSTVVDHASGELVEKVTYTPTGDTESDYRPERWKSVREAYRFTGKEDDFEVGLTYFGHRYLMPALGRWASPDPLAIHVLGADLNPYAYVSGRLLRAVDPIGLKACEQADCGKGGEEEGGGEAPTYDPGWSEDITVRADAPADHGDGPIVGNQFAPGDRTGSDGARGRPGGGGGGVGSGAAAVRKAINGTPAAGTVFGGLAAATPCGFLVPPPPGTNANFRLGMAVGQIVFGILEATLGGVGTGASALEAASVFASPLAAATAAVSVEVAANGVASVLAGVANLGTALKQGDGASDGEEVGKEPDQSEKSWSKARSDYWKSRSETAADGEFSPENLDRMREGKPPLHDELGVPKELHHEVPRREGGSNDPSNLREVWPWEHEAIDPYRHYKGPRPSGEE